jgi:hypothetical protein
VKGWVARDRWGWRESIDAKGAGCTGEVPCWAATGGAYLSWPRFWPAPRRTG